MSANLSNAITLASQIWAGMRSEGQSLEKGLGHLSSLYPSEEKSAAQSILYQVVRSFSKISFIRSQLIERLPPNDTVALVDVALGLLIEGHVNDFTVVNETVNAAKREKNTSFYANLINAVLRNYLRSKEKFSKHFENDLVSKYNVPNWWIRHIQKAYPKEWTSILSTQQQPPFFSLRVNKKAIDIKKYIELLKENHIEYEEIGHDALLLPKPLPVEKVPGFYSGFVSVQDPVCQLAAQFLNPPQGARVLDACSAPGGKTTSLLENYDIQLTALDIEEKRLSLVKENLERLHLSCELLCMDASHTESIQSLGLFDSILLDAPCTGSGIVSKHPDIVWMRRSSDIPRLAQTQKKLLHSLWPSLKVGGHMLYCVCSIFPNEGKEQILSFIEEKKDAKLENISLINTPMMTLLPTRAETNPSLPKCHDGFFFALLKKENAK